MAMDIGVTEPMTLSVVDGCPAFGEGCPFSIQELAEILPSVLEIVPNDAANKCPAFQKGCPFKESDSVENLYNNLSEMPPTHRIGKDHSAARVVESTFQKVHEQSKVMKAKLNVECPVFATSCPFKTLTSGGELLVQELDQVVNNWGLEGVGSSPSIGPSPPPQHDLPFEDGQALPLPTDEPLSKTLKSGTKTVHRAAENVRFVRDFLKGKVPKESYIELLTSLFHVYSAMEKAIDSLPANLCHCNFGVLRRTETLEADLRYYTGTAQGQTLQVGPPSVAARQYVERLERLAMEDPLLILAHLYTRYLGDLSGGQILARTAVKTYTLSTGEGISFYNFEQIGTSASQVKAFKREYRSSLDALQLSTLQADALVEEANVAFLMNMLLFEERDVAAGHLKGIRSLEEVLELVKTNTSALSFQRAYGEDKAAAPGGNKCPFLPDPSRNEDDDVASVDQVCPWPCLCFRDPRSALAVHPRKSIGSILAVMGLGASAWHFPRSTGLGVLGSVMMFAHSKTMRARVPHLLAAMR